MKKQLLLTLFILSNLIFIFSACRRKKEPACSGDPNQCQSVLEAKDYFAFKLGTWWVYEEENSGDRDSVYVTESSIDPHSYQFNVRMYSTYQDCYYHYWPEYYGGTSIPSCSETQPVDKRCLIVKKSKYQYGNYIGSSKVFFLKYAVGSYDETGYCVGNRITIENIFESYSISNFSFSKTIKIEELCSDLDNNQETNYYYSKGVGIIKKEFIDSNQVWNLVNYHIEP